MYTWQVPHTVKFEARIVGKSWSFGNAAVMSWISSLLSLFLRVVLKHVHDKRTNQPIVILMSVTRFGGFGAQWVA